MNSMPTDAELKQELREWVMERIKGYYAGPSSYPVAVLRGEELLAVVIYDNWRGTDITLTVAAESPRWITKETAATLLTYPFTTLNVSRITALARKDNKRSRRLIRGMGFKEEGCVRCADYDGADMILYGLTRQDLENTLRRFNNE